MRRIYLKIISPTLLAILFFVLTIFMIIIPRYRESIMDGKREMIRELTNSAWSILQKYEADEREGLISREEAQQTVISRIQYLRYGEEFKDYFWITDLEPRMVMHPFRPDLNNRNLSEFKDPHGKRMFVEMAETVKLSDHGYVDYMWQWKDDSLKIVPKVSFVKLFKPWNWVIGTGIYIEDVEREIASITERLLWISGLISMLIAALLFYGFKQSLDIEHKRTIAEQELNDSREKYRALVDAAKEGLILVADGKISYANQVITRITGFSIHELTGNTLKEIVSENNNEDVFSLFIRNEMLGDGQFEVNLKTKKSGFTEVLITSSKSELYGKPVNVLIVKDISIGSEQRVARMDFQNLISTLSFGFFKLSLAGKGQFLYSNQTALNILGCESMRELSELSIPFLFSNLREIPQLRDELMRVGFVKNRVMTIFRRNRSFAIVSVSLVVLKDDKDSNIICDGIVEDITCRENEKLNMQNLLAELKAGQLMMEQDLSPFLQPHYTIDMDSTIDQALEKLSNCKTDTLIVTKNGEDHIGIITNTDIQQRIFKLKLNLDNPVYLVMSSPIVYSFSSCSVSEALNVCHENKINHLVIKNSNGRIDGVFATGLVYKRINESVNFYVWKVKYSRNIDELKHWYGSMVSFVRPLINSGINIKYITNITSAVSDSIIKKVLEITIGETGSPPVDFAFICLGSEGRKEESFFTDQDNAIIFDDVDAGREAAINSWFIELAARVNYSLKVIGYEYCKGNVMAMNPMWNKPFRKWSAYFREWILEPEPQNLLDASIFFDFRHIYGNEAITGKLRKQVQDQAPKQPVFLYHLANNMFRSRIPQISSAPVNPDKSGEFIDLKPVVNQIIMFARIYSLANGISETNTYDRLLALKTNQVLTFQMADELIYAYNFLMMLRFRNQLMQIDKKLEVTNLLNTKDLIEPEFWMLKRILGKFQEYHDKLGIDFRLNV